MSRAVRETFQSNSPLFRVRSLVLLVFGRPIGGEHRFVLLVAGEGCAIGIRAFISGDSSVCTVLRVL